MRRIPATIGLIAANTILFLIIAFIEDSSIFDFTAIEILNWGANFNPYTKSDEPWRLISSMFLHFGIIHLAVNIHSLFSLGKMIERQIGTLNFMLVYLMCGIAGGLASLHWNLFVISAGASGAIFGLYGFVLMMDLIVHYRNRQRIMGLIINFVIFVFVNIAITKIFSVDTPGHVGGLVFGAILGAFYSLIVKQPRRPKFLFAPFLLSIGILMIPLYLIIPTFQVQYFDMFQHVIATDEFAEKAMRGNKSDSEFRKSYLMATVKWDTTLHKLQQIEGLPEPLLLDRAILQEYIHLRKEDLRYRIAGIERQSYIYIDSTELIKNALNKLPRVTYILNFNPTKQPPKDTIQSSVTYTEAYYDSSWQETTKNKAVYYRQGGKDSLEQWSGYVVDFYLNNNVQMKGSYTENLKNGVFLYYSTEQTYEAAGRYENDYKVGKWEYFHQNGRLEREVNHAKMNYILNAWDSTGKQVITAGEGEIVQYYFNGNLKSRGEIQAGLREGKWIGFHPDGSTYYEELYNNGRLEMGRAVLKTGEKYAYDESSFYANPEGGWDAFYAYVSNNGRYPEEARNKRIKGTVTVAFTVAEDGKVFEILFLNKLGFGCEEEAKRLLLEGPRWLPGRAHGHEPYSSQSRVDIFFGEQEKI